jgi:hypothetical protein
MELELQNALQNNDTDEFIKIHEQYNSPIIPLHIVKQIIEKDNGTLYQYACENHNVDDFDIKHVELQLKLLHTIDKMKEVGCELPHELKLFYSINDYRDSRGHAILAAPYLSWENAEKAVDYYSEGDDHRPADSNYTTTKCGGHADGYYRKIELQNPVGFVYHIY